MLYKITNKLNGMIYIGVHKTQNKNDSYMGSGSKIKLAIKKYGKENFKKTILKECSSSKELFKSESQMVNEDFLKRKDVYNLALGGYNGVGFTTKGKVTVKDSNGNTSMVSVKDSRYLSGELKPILFGKVIVKDSKGKTYQVDKNNPRYLKGKLISVSTGMVTVKDKNENNLRVSKKDSRYLSGELKSVAIGKIIVKNLKGKTFQISLDDPRYNKTLFPIWKNKKHSEETKAKIGKANSIHQLGKRNSQFGTMWITNESENRKVSKDLKRLPKGFRKGRKQNLNK